MDDALSGGMVQVYDPFVRKDIVPNQHHNFDTFLDSVDLVVIMVGHDEIKQNIHRLTGKVILDTKNICNLPSTYKL